MKNTFLKFAVLATVAAVVLTSCKKQVTEMVTDQVSVALAVVDDNEAEATFSSVSNGVSGANDDLGFSDTEFGDDITPSDPIRVKCYTITVSPIAAGVFPKTVTIDFGTGCLCKDGKTRKGKIVTVFTGRLRVPGSTATSTFDGYYVNDIHVEGVHKIENSSSAEVRRITRTVTDGKLTKTNGNYIGWNSTHTSTQTTGAGTPNYYWDDEFDITGNATGSSSKSGILTKWTRTISNALHKKANCKWFDKGSVEITVTSANATLNFGDGSCDNKATFTIKGVSKEITLP